MSLCIDAYYYYGSAARNYGEERNRGRDTDRLRVADIGADSNDATTNGVHDVDDEHDDAAAVLDVPAPVERGDEG